MVPKVAARGTSFKGAGAYYLHDKKARSAARVAFTHTENLPTDNAEQALKCMAYTALHQDALKRANGSAATGRKLAKPVYTYSLSWAPDETPSQEQMIAAARETLEALGLSDHEVLMVAHNDEPHPHIHLIVNRVHPETGKAAVLSNDHLGLSRWAEDYERRNGKIRCEERVKNNAARRRGMFAKDRRSLDPAAFHRWRREQAKKAYAARRASSENLAAFHKGQRQALGDERKRIWRQYRQDMAARRREVRTLNKPQWAALFRSQREELKALNEAQKTAWTRLLYHLKNRQGPAGKDGVKNALRAVFGQDNPHGVLARKHQAERKALARAVSRQTREALQELDRDFQAVLRRHENERADLERRHKKERTSLARDHSAQSQERARKIREGSDEKEYLGEKGEAMRSAFMERVKARAKQTKKRREDERKKDRDGGRERDR